MDKTIEKNSSLGISSNNKRIAKNTIYLYIRSLLTMFIGLFTVRIVLKTLGEQDYGIYAVVGGLLAFLTFISGALSTGSQRFFSNYLGLQDQKGLNETFRVTFFIYLILSGIIILGGEVIGVWFINTHLNIPPDRIFATNVIFQFVIISTAFSLITNPFMSSIMAHEDMHIIGKMAVLDGILKISICVLLVISPWDKLVSYAFLLLVSVFLVQSIYLLFARKKYEECVLIPKWDKKKFKEITSFSGWNLFGSLAWVGKIQGTSILLNMFFGPLVNAAQGVANTVRNVAGTFSGNFSSAIQPQIVKKYATQDYDNLRNLVHRGSKMTYFLMMIVVTPLIFTIDFIMQMWLGDHNRHMETFCQIILIEALIDSISSPLASVNQATGKIAVYQALIGFFGLLNLPIAYVFIKLNYAPEWVFIASVFLQIFIVAVRIVFLHRIYPGAMKGAIKNILLPCGIVTLFTFLICYLFNIHLRQIITDIPAIIGFILINIFFIWIFGLNKEEKTKIVTIIKNRINIKFSR